jgi:integrase
VQASLCIGTLPLCDVTPSHIRGILDEVVAKGLKRGTVEQVRGVLHRLFDDAWRAELIEANPVARVRVPPMREVRKDRCILTDGEFSRFVASGAVDLELRMLALVARCEGGMRTGDLNAWDWSMIDRVDFAECFVPRGKTRTPQALAIPEALAPFLRAWWERADEPESGPVFPARRGKHAGEFKSKKGTYAARLRRDLFRAGAYRLPPVEVPARKPGQRTDLGKSVTGTKLAPNPRDPLYFETATTLPVDFHSFRRAFASALAEAGVNVQQAMHLAADSDPKVHARYVMGTAAMRAVPDAALPRLPAVALAHARMANATASGSRSSGLGNVTLRDVSSEAPKETPTISEREKGSETGINKRGQSRALARDSAGFANPDPDRVQRQTAPNNMALGNWWETDDAPGWGVRVGTPEPCRIDVEFAGGAGCTPCCAPARARGSNDRLRSKRSAPTMNVAKDVLGSTYASGRS